MIQSLFDRVGGKATVEASVDKFYSKFLAHGDVAIFFKHVEMESQRKKLRIFFNLILGGKNDISKSRIIDIHQPLVLRGLRVEHLDLWLTLTRETLQELDIPLELIEEFMDLCKPYDNAIRKLIKDYNCKT